MRRAHAGAGKPKFWAGGLLEQTPGIRRSLCVESSVVGDGGTFKLLVKGVSGDRVHLALGREPSFQFVPHPLGVRLVPLPKYLDWNAGIVLGPNGSGEILLPAHELPPGAWRSLIAQAVVFPAAGGKAIGGAVLLTNIDN